MTAESTTDFITPERASTSLPSAPSPAEKPEDITTAETEREAAFSFDPVWNGKLLHPFSIERYIIFVTQRCAVGAPTLGMAIRDGAAFYPDALRILWICSQTEETLTIMRQDHLAIQRQIEAWATDHAPVSRAADVVTLGLHIFNSAYDNRHDTRPYTGTSSSSSGN